MRLPSSYIWGGIYVLLEERFVRTKRGKEPRKRMGTTRGISTQARKCNLIKFAWKWSTNKSELGQNERGGVGDPKWGDAKDFQAIHTRHKSVERGEKKGGDKLKKGRST